MSTTGQIVRILLLVVVLVFVLGLAYGFALDVLPQATAALLAFVILPVVLALVVRWSGYLRNLGYNTSEEQLFRPYYEASVTDRLWVIGAVALLGLVPLIVTILVLSEFERPWIQHHPFAIVLSIYVLTVVSYTAILFEPTRELYRRNAAPLLILLTGLIIFYTRFSAVDTVGSREWATILGTGAITLYGGLFLLRASQSIADKKSRMETEIAFAAEVQRQFLQSRQVTVGKLTAYATSRPARQLGGDFFYVSRHQEGRFIATLGDVSGHGFGAGLIMTMLKTSFENFRALNIPLERVLYTLNDQLLEQTNRSMFATLTCVDIDAATGEGMLWNAGHMPLLHYREQDDRVQEVHRPGLALGLTKNTDYTPEPMNLDPGDWFVLYSDGVVETRDEDGEVRDVEFFSDMVRDVIEEADDPEGAAESILAYAGEVHREPFLQDDATLIVARFERENTHPRK